MYFPGALGYMYSPGNFLNLLSNLSTHLFPRLEAITSVPAMDFDETLPMMPDETQYYAPDEVPDAVPDAGLDEAWCPPEATEGEDEGPKTNDHTTDNGDEGERIPVP